jgi:hypothetical protein
MVASKTTILEVMHVVLKHVDRETAHRIVADLQKIEGNQSFKQTVYLLARYLELMPNTKIN